MALAMVESDQYEGNRSEDNEHHNSTFIDAMGSLVNNKTKEVVTSNLAKTHWLFQRKRARAHTRYQEELDKGIPMGSTRLADDQIVCSKSGHVIQGGEAEVFVQADKQRTKEQNESNYDEEDDNIMVAQVFVGEAEMEEAYQEAAKEKRISNESLVLLEMSVRRPIRGLDDELMWLIKEEKDKPKNERRTSVIVSSDEIKKWTESDRE